MMRKVNKNFEQVPPALEQGFLDKKESLKKKKAAHGFDGRVYNGTIKQELKRLYHNKCAYCESIMTDDTFTVEHYRPKGGKSNSYYWLGYEWSNLLPVCKKCNNPKDDKFPVGVPNRVPSNLSKVARRKEPLCLNGDWSRDAMRANHPYLLEEKPLLLHPEVDEPREYFYVNRLGQLVALFPKEENEERFKRAAETINLVKLNRDDLLTKRRAFIEDIEKSLRLQVKRFISRDIPVESYELLVEFAFFSIFERIEERLQAEFPFTLTAWSMKERIETLLFEPVHKGNADIKDLLHYALRLFEREKAW